MDELWQRYRSFWTPVLIGLGVFLVGLIAVHVVTENPDETRRRVRTEGNKVKGKVEPSTKQIRALRENRDALEVRVKDWAMRLDQAHGGDPVEAVVSDALKAALLRGVEPEVLRAAVQSPDLDASRAVLDRFEGDDAAAGRALARYVETRQQRLNTLRTGDLNVGFAQLLYDVDDVFRTRANRQDVELRVDTLGFSGVAAVDRQVLAQRLLNLARLAEILDLAIRSGVTTVVNVTLEQTPNPLGDDVFYREWPFSFTVQGDMTAIRPILDYLTNPEHPVPLRRLVLEQPPRGTPEEGRVQLTAKAASVLVRPDADLQFEE